MEKADRQKIIIRTSILGIAVNLAIAAVKVLIGLASSSLAIISEGINNASDAASAFLTLAGTRLSAKHPDEKHPFGYGRIEYLTSLVVAVLILYTGLSLLRESIDGIIHPSEMSVSFAAIAIVAVSAVCKLALGVYTIGMGRKTGSDALMAVGEEGRNDSAFSVMTIAVSLIYMVSGFSLDAYAGVIFALVVMKSGLETLGETVSNLIGRSGQHELAAKLYREIRSTKGIVNAADMMLHDYGPDAYSGSVNVELDHSLSIGEAYSFIHELQLRIMHEYKVTMVFGIYAVDEDSEESRLLRRTIGEFVKNYEHACSFHAVYMDKAAEKIYCDIIVDYKLEDWDALKEAFTAYMSERYPEKELELTIETEYV